MRTASPNARGCWGRMSVAAGLFVAVIVVSAAAWACVPQPYLVLQPRASGPPGSALTVEGQNFSGRSEVRWNGISGELLGTAEGRQVSIPITIPEVPDGLYTLVVVSRDSGGGIEAATPAAFQVVSEAGGTGSARPVTTAPTTTAPTPSQAVPPAIAAAGGAGLVIVAGVVGAVVGRRRERGRSTS